MSDENVIIISGNSMFRELTDFVFGHSEHEIKAFAKQNPEEAGRYLAMLSEVSVEVIESTGGNKITTSEFEKISMLLERMRFGHSHDIHIDIETVNKILKLLLEQRSHRLVFTRRHGYSSKRANAFDPRDRIDVLEKLGAISEEISEDVIVTKAKNVLNANQIRKDHKPSDPKGFNWNQGTSFEEDGLLIKNDELYKLHESKVNDLGGGVLSVPEFAKRMKSFGDTRSQKSIETTLRKLLSTGLLIGFKTNPGAKASWKIPAWQVNEMSHGSILSGVEELCTIFGSNGQSVQNFVINEKLNSGETPLDLLLKGKVDRVLELAKKYIGIS